MATTWNRSVPPEMMGTQNSLPSLHEVSPHVYVSFVFIGRGLSLKRKTFGMNQKTRHFTL